MARLCNSRKRADSDIILIFHSKQNKVVSREHSIDLLVEGKRSLELPGFLHLVLLQLFSESLHVGIGRCDHLYGEFQLKVSLFFHFHQ